MGDENKTSEHYHTINNIGTNEEDLVASVLFKEAEEREIKLEEERRKRIERNYQARLKRSEYFYLRITCAFIMVGLFALVSGYIVASVQLNVEAKRELQEVEMDESVVVQSIIYEDWKIRLVNEDNPLKIVQYTDLVDVGNGVQVDSRIKSNLDELIKTGKKEAGLDIIVVNGYQSKAEQVEKFNLVMEESLENGASYLVAYEDTCELMSVPGTSEYELGLAVDLVGREYQYLDNKQGNTATAKWLSENAYRFGFILRYPQGKESVTKREYEAWHFRYVGENVAHIINNEDLTLEEYLNIK